MLQHIRWQYLVNGCEVGIIVRNYRETFPSDMCQKRMLKSLISMLSPLMNARIVYSDSIIFIYTRIFVLSFYIKTWLNFITEEKNDTIGLFEIIFESSGNFIYYLKSE